MGKKNSLFTPEFEEAILRMVRKGCSYTEIHRELGAADHVIVRVKRKYGLLPPPRKPLASIKDLNLAQLERH